MVIAAGCPYRLIVRACEGDSGAWAAIVGALIGISIFAQGLPQLNAFFVKYSYPQITYIYQLFKF